MAKQKPEAATKTTPPKKRRAYFKVLGHEGESPHVKFQWPLPGPDGTPGDWVEVKGPLVQCRNGLHLTPHPEHFYQDGFRIFETEYDPEGMLIPEGDHEVVVRKARLTRRLTWAELKAKWGITPEGGSRSRSSGRGPRPSKDDPGSPAPGERKEQSPAMKLLCFVGDEVRRKALSDSKRSSAYRAAMDTVITVGLTFALDDFKAIDKRWGVHRMFGERDYAEAVKVGHESALRSFEAFSGRKPFLYEGKRLHVGAGIVVGLGRDAHRWEVTSFDDQKGTLTVCAYQWKTKRYGSHKKIIGRKTVPHAEIAAAEAGLKANRKREALAKKLVSELHEYVTMPTSFNTGMWEKDHAEISERQVYALPDADLALAAEWVSECVAANRRRGGYGKVTLPPAPACVEKLITEAEREKARGIIQRAKYTANYDNGGAWEYEVTDAEIAAFLAGEDWKAILQPRPPKQKEYVPQHERCAKDPRIKALIPLLEGLTDPAWRPNVASVVNAYFAQLDRLDREKRERLKVKREAAQAVSSVPAGSPT